MQVFASKFSAVRTILQTLAVFDKWTGTVSIVVCRNGDAVVEYNPPLDMIRS